MSIEELKDKTSLKELVDRVSILADKKNFQAQALLFSENAVSETIAEGVAILKLRGRNEMIKAFDDFLADVETLFHFNGQHIVTINGDKATGTSYSLITLISYARKNDKKIKTSIKAIYYDDYVRENNYWLITKRIGNFVLQENNEIDR